jgi:adenosylcobyric acid synthase
MAARTLMVVGASSSAGKSLLVAALCRIFARRGLRVAPFKAQNMSNNAAVCSDGGEIGRAQAVQAMAAGVPLQVDFNPVLIKPEADARSQVVVMGRPFHTLSAADYYDYKKELWQIITAALDRLRAAYDLVIIEGAGSPVELNLKPGDLVNMRVAQYAQAPTLLVGDIDRGGIFAQLLGTLWLLETDERRLVRGLVVNKFRGDMTLFADGVRILEERGGTPVLGVIPWLKNLGIPEEDAVALDTPLFRRPEQPDQPLIDLAVVHLPLISNFDDFDPFQQDPGVRVRYISTPEELGRPSAVLLPGTKSTMADLDWLRRQGLAEAIQVHARQGGSVVGVCGGYQMLGQAIYDPQRVESARDETAGLGLLPVRTTFAGEKVTHQARARIAARSGTWLEGLQGLAISGYEIHMGRTESSGQEYPPAWLVITGRSGEAVHELDGAISADGKVWGCYLHGLFENPALRQAWLRSLGWPGEASGAPSDNAPSYQAAFDHLADAVEQALDMQQLEKLIWEN